MSKFKNLWYSVSFLAAFAVWTALVRFIDVKAIGPNGSKVGFATLNGFFYKLTGVDFGLYNITDWLGLVPVAFGFGFAILGLCQWIKRRNILKVDFSILALGGLYIVTVFFYLFFEEVVINCRPTLINGYLEASYPSSTTLLVLCVMPTALMQLNARVKNKTLKLAVNLIITAFIIFMVIGRLISGVHWLSDIIGGVLLSAGVVILYRFVCSFK